MADVIESLRGTDFYIPKHEVIFEAILTLYSHGEPTDVVAVTDEGVVRLLDDLNAKMPFSVIPGDGRSWAYTARAYLAAGAERER